ncbi:MAG: T9SS type A sorting domain-containing protein [Bacteroidales bacterium]
MKKFTLVLMMMLTFTGLTMSQTIENFESLKMNLMAAGDNGSLTVVPNPDPTGINTSTNVVKFVRGKGDPWGGFYATLPTAVDVTANKFVHVKVWKPRISPVKFKLENPNFEVASVNPQTIVNGWEELVFDFSAATGDYTKIVFMPDFEDPVTLTDYITIYFDDLTINNDPNVGSAAVQVMEDYEHIPLNIMLGGSEDLSSFSLVANPDKSGVNLSDYVIKFHRDMNGVPWGGFYSGTPIDVTTNKYMHVKVWKPRISPIVFKIEGGAAGTVEHPSMNPQTATGVWVDYVFNFSEKTGTYPTIVFMPDFEDPMTLTEDIDIYFDDIILNNDPNPMTPPEQIIAVDMNGAGLTAGQQVFLSGAIGGIHGTWMQPGTNPHNEMFDPDGDGIYTIYMHLADGLIAFKFFKGADWNNGDPVAGGDRTYNISGNIYLIYTWGVQGFVVSAPENSLAGKIQMYPNPVSNELYINSIAEVSRVIITSTMGKVVGNYTLSNKSNQTINTSALSSGMYFITFFDKDGKKQTQKLIKN